MSVFRIVRQPAAETPLKTATEDTAAEAEEVKEALAVIGDAPVKDAKDSTAPVFSLAEKPEDVLLKVNGPLGHLFTEALNKALALESMMMVPLMAEANDTGRSAVVVHVVDEDLLTASSVMAMNDSINASDTTVVAMETLRSTRVIGEKHAMVRRVCGGKAKLRFNLESAVSDVMAVARCIR